MSQPRTTKSSWDRYSTYPTTTQNTFDILREGNDITLRARNVVSQRWRAREETLSPSWFNVKEDVTFNQELYNDWHEEIRQLHISQCKRIQYNVSSIGVFHFADGDGPGFGRGFYDVRILLPVALGLW